MAVATIVVSAVVLCVVGWFRFTFSCFLDPIGEDSYIFVHIDFVQHVAEVQGHDVYFPWFPACAGAEVFLASEVDLIDDRCAEVPPIQKTLSVASFVFADMVIYIFDGEGEDRCMPKE